MKRNLINMRLVVNVAIFLVIVYLSFYYPQYLPANNTKSAPSETRQPTPGDARDTSGYPTSKKSSPKEGSETARITRVVDGDTVVLSDGRKVRYIGINAPEIETQTKKGQCYGMEAKERNRELVENKEVTLQRDTSDTDKYDRLLRYVYVGDVFINMELVREGFVTAKQYKPDTKYATQFEEEQKIAQADRKGMWNACSR